MRSAGLWHIGGLLPPQALTKLVHLRGHVLPGTADTERDASLVAENWKAIEYLCTQQRKNDNHLSVITTSTEQYFFLNYIHLIAIK